VPRPAARARLAAALLCATLGLGSCGTDQTATDQPTAEEGDMDQSAAPAGSPTTREAVADLARRLDVPDDQVVVERVEEVTWNDGSLGCAEKGTMYTQALVDGSRITLSAGGRTYEYHAGGGRAPFLCERPTQ